MTWGTSTKRTRENGGNCLLSKGRSPLGGVARRGKHVIKRSTNAHPGMHMQQSWIKCHVCSLNHFIPSLVALLLPTHRVSAWCQRLGALRFGGSVNALRYIADTNPIKCRLSLT